MSEMIRAFQTLRQLYDGFAGAETALGNSIGRSPCMSGCGRCCEVNTVQCLTIEAMNAVSLLTGLGKLRKAVDIAEGWLLEHHKEAPSYEGMVVGRFLTPELREEYTRISKLPCPFLQADKRCLIHEARPFVCRAYGVTRTTSGFCTRPPGKGETLTQFQYIQAPELKQDVDAFRAWLKRNHQPWVVSGFLPTLIYRAAEEKKFRGLVRDNRIASAKIIGVDIDTTLMWQPQLEKLQLGVMPDLVAQS